MIQQPPTQPSGSEPTVSAPGTAHGPFSAAFLENHRMVRELGRGGMGEVFLMRQLPLDRLVAVKCVRDAQMTEERQLLLLKEAQVLAQMNHPNIVIIHEFGTDGTTPYLVCEYVEGESLFQRLARAPLCLAAAIEICLGILDGLEAAHARGIVHRDLKPANIFLTTDGRPKIGDFGLAKAPAVHSGVTMNGLLGTPPYMSPEQCQAREATAASDIYALGVILHEMVVGQRPFPGPQIGDYVQQHTTCIPPDVCTLRPDLPSELAGVLGRALAKAPEARFASPRDFATALAAVPPAATPESTAGPARAPDSTGRPGAEPVISTAVGTKEQRVSKLRRVLSMVGAVAILFALVGFLRGPAMPDFVEFVPVAGVPSPERFPPSPFPLTPGREVPAAQLAGHWVDDRTGGTLLLAADGDGLTGFSTGGRGYEDVRPDLRLKRSGDHFIGTFSLSSWVVSFTGQCLLGSLSPDRVEYYYSGLCSRFGQHFRVRGKATLLRRGGPPRSP